MIALGAITSGLRTALNDGCRSSPSPAVALEMVAERHWRFQIGTQQLEHAFAVDEPHTSQVEAVEVQQVEHELDEARRRRDVSSSATCVAPIACSAVVCAKQLNSCGVVRRMLIAPK